MYILQIAENQHANIVVFAMRSFVMQNVVLFPQNAPPGTNASFLLPAKVLDQGAKYGGSVNKMQ